MTDPSRTNRELLEEISVLNQRIQELEHAESDRKQAGEALRRAEENFRRSLDDSPLGIRIVTTEGETIYANRAILDIHGYESIEDLISTPVKKRYTPESYAEFKIRREKRKRGDYDPSEYEISIVRKDGEVRYLQVFRKRVLWDGERRFQVVYQDITERKQAEKTLQLITDNMSDMIRVTDLHGVILYSSPSHAKVLGYKPDDRIGKSAFDIVHPGDLEYVINVFSEGLVKKKSVKVEYRIKHAEGHYVWLETIGDLLRDDQGEVTAVIMSSRHITERKQAEEALSESEEKYRVIFNNEIFAICIFDLETLTLLDANDAYSSLYGYSREELVSGMTIHDITAERQVSDAATKQAIREGTIFIPLRYHRKKDGTVFPVEIVGGPYTWKGRKVMFALAHDISERYRAEQELQRSNERSQAVQRIGRVGYLDWDLLTNALVLSQEALEIYHLDRTPTLDKIMGLVHPDDKELVEKSLNAAVSGTARHDIEHRTICPDGTEIYIHASAELFRSDDGTPARLLGTIHDITERKRAEAELKASEERFRELFNYMSSGVAVYEAIDNGGDFIFRDFNPAAEKIEKVSRKDILGKRVSEIFPGVKAFGVFEVFKRVWQTGKLEYFPQNIYKDESDPGSWRESWVFKLPTGEIVSVYNDITARKRAEEALRETEERYRTLVENASDIVFRTDGTGHLTFINPAALRIAGYQEDEVIGKHYVLLIHSDMREEAIKFFGRQFVKRIQNTYFEYPLLAKNGNSVWVGQNTQLIMEEDRVTAFQAVARDITERKQAEEESRLSSERLKEAQRIGKLGFLDWDLSSDGIELSDQTLLIYGLDQENKKPKNEELLKLVHSDDVNLVRKSLNDAIAGIAKFDLEHRLVRPDGEERYVHATAEVVRDPSDKPVRVLGTILDITERKRAEEALREEHQRMAGIIKGTNVGTWEWNVQTGETIFNDRWAEIIGYTLDEISPVSIETWMKFAHEDDLKASGELLEKHFHGELEYYEFESRMKHKDGNLVWVLDRGKVTSWAKDGKPLVMMGTHQDITAQKRAEEALRESEERFRRLANATWEGIIIHREGAIMDANESASRILGYPVEEIIGKNILTFIAPESIEPTIRKLREGTTHDQLYLELNALRKDKTIFPAEALGRPIRYNNIDARVLAFRDISDRKRAEDVLRASEEKYRVLFEGINEAVFVHDLEEDGLPGRFLQVNDVACRRLGYTREELMSLTPRDITIPEEYERLADKRIGLASQGDILAETIHLTKDGKKIPVESNIRQFQYLGRQVALSISRDISDRKRAEEERTILEERLRQADKMEAIGTLAGGIAHDFNNLLMGIQGHASLALLDLDPSHPHYERLKSIEEQVESGAALTKQLLGFARGGRYEVKPADLNDILKKSSSMFGRTKKEITINRKYGKDLWPVEVDRGQMEQVFMNLYVNAWQAMPGGGKIYLETENVLLDDEQAFPYAITPGKYVKISVTDTGTGMDEKTRARIFDPFFTTKEMGRGTGLGLATVYGIIKGHKGMINVYSEPGHGTTFTIYLPASEKDVVKEKTATGTIARGMETILLVDDEKMVLEVSKAMLESMGYRIYAAESGQEAIAVYMEKQKEIDLILLDMIMPGISGGETFDRLLEINPDAKVLLSSGYSIEGQAQEIIDRGCSGFLQKPFRLEMLSRKVREMID